MSRRIPLVLTLLSLACCTPSPERDPVLGEAFVGPASLQIREELTAHSPLVATVKYGEKLQLVGQRRHFYKVRTAGSAEGWVDGRQLLSPGNMRDLKNLAERARDAPPQGRATVYETLNVHTEPNRQSPSFFQIQPAQPVDVVAHERAPRIPFAAPDFLNVNGALAAGSKRPNPKPEPKLPPPPPGRPPAVPPNWLELSGNPDGFVPDEGETLEPAGTKPQPAAAPMDDWTLIRDKEGHTGWVLARMLLMGIPDEVAQYAERARIVAYFTLGKVNDHGVDKPVWLWATLAQRDVPFQFDSLRIFFWNMHRHRYETSFIERGLKGYLPLHPTGLAGGQASGFQVVVEEKDGRLVERSYALNGFRARVATRRQAAPVQPWHTTVPAGAPQPVAPAPRGKESWRDRARSLFNDLKDRIKR